MKDQITGCYLFYQLLLGCLKTFVLPIISNQDENSSFAYSSPAFALYIMLLPAFSNARMTNTSTLTNYLVSMAWNMIDSGPI